MENQHRKISGYRELTEYEIALMNEIKSSEAEALRLCARLSNVLQAAADKSCFEGTRSERAEAKLWLEEGRRELQTAYMKLVRAVAQPQPKEDV